MCGSYWSWTISALACGSLRAVGSCCCTCAEVVGKMGGWVVGGGVGWFFVTTSQLVSVRDIQKNVRLRSVAAELSDGWRQGFAIGKIESGVWIIELVERLAAALTLPLLGAFCSGGSFFLKRWRLPYKEGKELSKVYLPSLLLMVYLVVDFEIAPRKDEPLKDLQFLSVAFELSKLIFRKLLSPGKSSQDQESSKKSYGISVESELSFISRESYRKLVALFRQSLSSSSHIPSC